VTKSKSNW